MSTCRKCFCIVLHYLFSPVWTNSWRSECHLFSAAPQQETNQRACSEELKLIETKFDSHIRCKQDRLKTLLECNRPSSRCCHFLYCSASMNKFLKMMIAFSLRHSKHIPNCPGLSPIHSPILGQLIHLLQYKELVQIVPLISEGETSIRLLMWILQNLDVNISKYQ